MFRMSRYAAAGSAGALLLTLALSACQSDDPAPSVSESVAPSPSASPTDTDPAEAGKEKNVADAKQRYREFLAISNKHSKEGTNAYEEYVRGGYLGDQAIMSQMDSYWDDYVEKKLKQTGDGRIVSMDVTEYEGDPLADTVLGHRVHMKVCIDTSEVDVLGPDGASVRQGGVPERMVRDVLMQGQLNVWSVRENNGTGETC